MVLTSKDGRKLNCSINERQVQMFFLESRVCEKNIKYYGKRIAISKNIRYN